jgi:gas vesicle protein
MTTKKPLKNNGDNHDSLVGTPSHKVATGVGALVGGVAVGAVTGTAAGPIGTVVGAVVGAIAGGLGADAAAESVDEIAEEAHWRKTWESRPDARRDESYDDFGPAYAYGVTAYRTRQGTFDEIEKDLSREWTGARGSSRLAWDSARQPTRDAYDRLDRMSNRS